MHESYRLIRVLLYAVEDRLQIWCALDLICKLNHLRILFCVRYLLQRGESTKGRPTNESERKLAEGFSGIRHANYRKHRYG